MARESKKHPSECGFGLWPGSQHAAICPKWQATIAELEQMIREAERAHSQQHERKEGR